jgi:hypothetical protein
VWQWTVAKDQIESDLVVMDALLDRCQDRAIAKLRLGVPCWGIMCVEACIFTSMSQLIRIHRFVLAICAKALPGSERIRSPPVQLILWVLSGASGLNVLYTGLGYWLVRWFRRRAARILTKLEDERLIDEDRTAFSGWRWHLPRFTNVF